MSDTKVGIIDYGMGNISSVSNSVAYLGYEFLICNSPSQLSEVDKIILPGVGAFRDCLSNLKQFGFIEKLNKMVLGEKYPILGICLGMQAMAKWGFEGGEFEGLGWIDAEVRKIKPLDSNYRVPHIGWNDIQIDRSNAIFSGMPEEINVYFVHSYHLQCKDPSNVIATCDYSSVVTAAINQGNIWGTQFHPEKSQELGLRIIRNFIEYKC